jgi:hypothetical protein
VCPGLSSVRYLQVISNKHEKKENDLMVPVFPRSHTRAHQFASSTPTPFCSPSAKASAGRCRLCVMQPLPRVMRPVFKEQCPFSRECKSRDPVHYHDYLHPRDAPFFSDTTIPAAERQAAERANLSTAVWRATPSPEAPDAKRPRTTAGSLAPRTLSQQRWS